MKSKIEKFRDIIKEHRKELKGKYPAVTINSWIYTGRIPKFETACELAPILGMKINQIPYYKVERG
jgi:hypothetical protein